MDGLLLLFVVNSVLLYSIDGLLLMLTVYVAAVVAEVLLVIVTPLVVDILVINC